MSNSPKLTLIDRTSFPSKICLPDLVGYTSQYLDTKINPHWKEVEAASYAWFDSYGIHSGSKRERYFNAGFGLMGALAYADADLEHLRPSMDFVLWLFAFDDMTDEGGLRDNVDDTKSVVETMMDVLHNPDTAEPKFKIAASLHSFFNRMRENSNAATMKRFVDSTELYTIATLQQTVNRSADDAPTIEEFIQLRRDTSAVKMGYPVLEYSLGLNLSDEVHEDPIILELELAGNDILTWANDVYSFPVELSRGDTHNLVFLAMLEKQIDLEAAMEYVAELTRQRMQDYVEAKKKLRSFGPEIDSQVVDYLRGLEYLVMGSIAWSFMTPRYFGANAEKVKETGMVDIVTPVAPIVPITVE